MDFERFFYDIVDEFRAASLTKWKSFDELCRLIVYRQISENEDQLPDLAEIVMGKVSIRDAYKAASGLLFLKNEKDLSALFENTVVPDFVSGKQLNNVIYRLLDIRNYPRFEFVEALFDFGLRYLHKKEFTAISSDLADLLYHLSGLQGCERDRAQYPFSQTLRVAVRQAKSEGQASAIVENNTAFNWAVSWLLNIRLSIINPMESSKAMLSRDVDRAEVIIQVPPFGVTQANTQATSRTVFDGQRQSLIVSSIKNALDSGAKCIISVVTNGFLFRSGEDSDFRASLIDKGIIDAVIQLPEKALTQFNVPISILVINTKRDKQAPVLFYNADQGYHDRDFPKSRHKVLLGWEKILDGIANRAESPIASLVKKEKIQENHYDLSVANYVLGEATKAVQSLGQGLNQKVESLEYIADLIRAQPLKEDIADAEDEFLIANLTDIQNNGLLGSPAKIMKLAGRARNRAQLQALEPNDILLGIKGTVGKIGLVGEDCRSNWVANQNFVIIRLKKNAQISPIYLFRYLQSPLMQAYMQEVCSGTAMPMLKTADIKNLAIPLQDSQDQKDVEETHREILSCYEGIQKLQDAIAELNAKHWANV